MSEIATAIPVALLYPNDAAGEQIRAVLLGCGTPIVYETLAAEADRDALEKSGARVVVVDLDSEVDGYLDDIQNLLTESSYRVVFNDGQVSSALTGWDQARWIRHLAAKIRGDNEMNPPRPLNAESIPTRASLAHAANEALGRDDDPANDQARVAGLDEIAGTDREIPPIPDFDLPDSLEQPDVASAEASSDECDDEQGMDFLDAPPLDEAHEIPEIEQRATEASDAPDFSDWSIEDLAADEPPPVAPFAHAPRAEDIGVEIVEPEEFLAPQTDAPGSRDSILDELELEPLEDNELASLAEPRPDHEAWFDTAAIEAKGQISRIWIVAAATGGPQAVRTALSKLPADYPAVFMLVQQMGSEFIDVMLDQLAGSTALRILHPATGRRIVHGDVVVVPADQTFSLEGNGIAKLVDEEDVMSVDRLLCEVADVFGEMAGVIVFSGVSADSLDGIHYLRDKGGTVWVQDPDTCLVGGLAEAARDAGMVDFSATAEQIADRLLFEGINAMSDQ